MYKKQLVVQISFEDFDYPMGLKMNPDNRWIKKADLIPWQILEPEYAKLFKNKKRKCRKTIPYSLWYIIDSTRIWLLR